MRAGVITGLAQFDLLDVLEPTPSPTGAVIEIQLCGVCGSDVHAYAEGWRYPPNLCGHEWFGSVAAVSAQVQSTAQSELVMGGVATGCGARSYCIAGQPHPGPRPRASDPAATTSRSALT